MTTRQRIHYLLLNWRAWKHALEHPMFTAQLFGKRMAFTFTRRFCGDTLTSPVTGEKIFNIQSLVNYWSMHVVRELGDNWQSCLREKISPVVFDVGANMGQFGRLVVSINPSAKVIAFEPWENMQQFNQHVWKFFPSAAGSKNGMAQLTKAKREGWTASTSSTYGTVGGPCPQITLDEVWESIGSPQVALLKIDVDGAESEVLAGAKEMLKHTDVLLVEVLHDHPSNILPTQFHWNNFCGIDWVGVKSL